MLQLATDMELVVFGLSFPPFTSQH